MVTKQGKELESMMAHPVFKNPLEMTSGKVPEQFDSLDYANIHNLPDHRDKRNDFDLWMTVHMTANLIHILKHTTFFEEHKDENKFVSINRYYLSCQFWGKRSRRNKGSTRTKFNLKLSTNILS